MLRTSIVIPTFNRAALVAETLDAVLTQTVAADEIIVVDDGSTDDTPAVLARYAPRVVTIRSENRGDMAARNSGLRAAKGRHVAFCDSDDLWEPGFIEAMVRFWQAAPNAIAAYTDFRELRDGALAPSSKFADAPDGFWLGAHPVAPGCDVFEQSIVARLLVFQPFFPSCMMVDRERFAALGGWDEAVSRIVGCDFATALRVADAPPIGVIRQPLVRIRKHGSNISRDVEAMNLGDARVLEHVINTRPELHALAGQVRSSVAKRRLDALDSAFARRDFGAVKDIDRLVTGHPRSRKHLVKIAVAGMPQPLRTVLANALSRVSERRVGGSPGPRTLPG